MGRSGLGVNSTELSSDDIKHYLEWFWAGMWVYNLSLTATKLAILFQYKRVFHTRKFQIAVMIELFIIAVCGLWTIVGKYNPSY